MTVTTVVSGTPPGPTRAAEGERTAYPTQVCRPPTSAAAEAVVRLEGVEVRLGGLPILRDIDLALEPGRCHGLVGGNGSGKTTTIAKLAHLFIEQDYGVMLAAGDTFRAAAIEQLSIWADRVGVPIVSGPEGGDAAGIVFDAVKKATAEGIDVLIVDTAGRLHNRRELMDELAKIRRVLGRLNPASPHDVVLVLDATTGQNALSQIEVFKEIAGVTGLVMTKLDGSARGGILVAAAKQFGLPIHAIGVGETMEDLRPFNARDLARAIAGGDA